MLLLSIQKDKYKTHYLTGTSDFYFLCGFLLQAGQITQQERERDRARTLRSFAIDSVMMIIFLCICPLPCSTKLYLSFLSISFLFTLSFFFLLLLSLYILTSFYVFSLYFPLFLTLFSFFLSISQFLDFYILYT